jgi:hypothetical protein
VEEIVFLGGLKRKGDRAVIADNMGAFPGMMVDIDISFFFIKFVLHCNIQYFRHINLSFFNICKTKEGRDVASNVSTPFLPGHFSPAVLNFYWARNISTSSNVPSK